MTVFEFLKSNPGYAREQNDKHEELNRLITLRLRFIAYLQRAQGVSLTQAEEMADGKRSIPE